MLSGMYYAYMEYLVLIDFYTLFDPVIFYIFSHSIHKI